MEEEKTVLQEESRQSSIGTEPLTLGAEEMQRVKERVAEVLHSLQGGQAMDALPTSIDDVDVHLSGQPQQQPNESGRQKQ